MDNTEEIQNIDRLIVIWEKKLEEMGDLVNAGKTKGMSLVELMGPLQMLSNLQWQKKVLETSTNKELKINGIS